MPLATATISFDLADMLGVDFDTRRTKVWVTTNVADDVVIDTTGNKIRLGSGNVTLLPDGTGSFTVWVPSADSNPTSWQTYVHVDYPDRAKPKGRETVVLGPFTITASADLSDLVDEQAIPPDFSGAGFIAEVEAIRDQQKAIAGLTGEDSAVALLVETPTSATAAALSATFVPVVRAVGMTGGTDCTTALQGFFSDASAAGAQLIIPAAANGLPYKCSAILNAWTGARIIGEGRPVIDFQTDHSAIGRGLYIGDHLSTTASGVAAISDVEVRGLTLISSNATARNGVYGLLSVFDASNVTLEDIHIGDTTANSGGESTAIYTANTTDLRIVRPVSRNTLADGIHLSRATQRAVVDHPVVIGAQDDGVAVVSNRQDGTGPIYEPCRWVQINQPTVLNSITLGSGVVLVGAQDCTVMGGSVDNVPAGVLRVTQANYGGIINAARNTIVGLVGTNADDTNGSIRVGDADRTALVGVEVSNCEAGVVIIGSTRTRLTGCAIDSVGASQYGVYDDTASARTNVSGCVLDGNSAGAVLLQGTGSISTGANITA